MNFRPYQIKSIEQIKEEFLRGIKKVLLWLATGSGKTVIFCHMAKEAVIRGKRVIILVRGRKLVKQASDRLTREHVPHGILMANHWNFRPHMPVQVCSIDTLISRGLKPVADLIIIDEADLATSKGYKNFLCQYDDAYIVSVTATPWVEDGLRHICDSVVHPITMQELIDQGYLSDFRYFAPAEPDLRSVKVSASTHDYVSDQLEESMVSGQLTGKIIDHWKSLASDRKTILFAVNVHHSKLLTENFINAGIKAEHCDADTPDEEREAIIHRLESGETKIICNVGINGRGVDIPSVGAIILARPTMSRNLYVQQCGRGTRIYEGKKDCILLDHAGNIARHGFPTDEPEFSIDSQKFEGGIRRSKICKNCFAVYRDAVICPECGSTFVRENSGGSRILEESDGQLKEIKKVEKNPIEKMIIELEKERKKSDKKKGWTWHKLVDTFGFEECKPYLPEWFVSKTENGRANPFSHSPFKFKIK